jgi:branched-chain amino acid transport system permease protein
VRPAFLVAGLAGLGLVPVGASLAGEPFYVTLFSRILVFGIAALSLDLILGYGGMVSFGHAAYIGVGAYAVGILSHHGVSSGWAHVAVAVVASALIAAAVGAVSLRTTGVYFIMITLAFAQMLYFLGVSLKAYGGDDGMTLARRSQFGALVDLKDGVVFYYVVLALLVVFLYGSHRLVRSRFGMALRGIRSNEPRMRAIGFPAFRYKLAAFVIAGTMCGIAGVLLANLTDFVTPAFMHWTRSGEILVMVILGGMGTLVGPVLGALVLLALEEVLASYTQHWMVILGPVLLLIVLFAKRGLLGLLRSSGGGLGGPLRALPRGGTCGGKAAAGSGPVRR